LTRRAIRGERSAAPSTTKNRVRSRQNLEDSLDFNGGVKRQLRDADGEARMLAVLAQNGGDEIGGAVDDLRERGEVRRAIDVAAEPNGAQLGKVADCGVGLGKNIERRLARRSLPGFERNAGAKFALMRRIDAIGADRQLSRYEEQCARARVNPSSFSRASGVSDDAVMAPQ